jgi:hypothetical protein
MEQVYFNKFEVFSAQYVFSCFKLILDEYTKINNYQNNEDIEYDHTETE